MKKTYLILLAAFILAACTAPPTNRDATSNTNANKPPETKAAVPLTEAEATAKEKELWATLSKQDINAFTSTLAEDQIYVTGDGVHDKASSIKGVTGFVPTDVRLTDFKLITINNNAVLSTYKATIKGTMNGEAFPESSAYASTIWVNRDGKWLAVYHQDADVLTPPPPPPAKAAPKVAASPAAASTPVATTSDVEANEKAVWDALKGGHFDVFESFLATDFLEVEPFGVFTRAESVKGVQGTDFSKSTLSDWKTVKINPEATLVTYTAHFPGAKPDTEYHSTVWANRNGKWTGVFHMGTHKAPPQPPPKTAAKK